MRLTINIPCLNEEKTLPLVLAELPRKIPGIKRIDVQVVDDGSTDRTVEVARKHGCIVIRHKRNLGLGMAFRTGVEAALERGCDVFVNTDADNQYPGEYIPALVAPVLHGTADIVIGNRTPWRVRHFSPIKRFFQRVGNAVTRRIMGVRVPDTVSGFRAYNHEALLQLNVTTKFSYVLDTIVQAAKKGLTIASIPIETNPPTRRSRLFRNIAQHMFISGMNLVRLYIIYEPFRTFLWLAALALLPASILITRYVVLFVLVGGQGHIQSLILAAILSGAGFVLVAMGVLAHLIGLNRQLTERQLYLAKKQRYS